MCAYNIVQSDLQQETVKHTKVISPSPDLHEHAAT